MTPFRLDQKEFIRHNILNETMSISGELKVGSIDGARVHIEKLEQFVKSLPAYFCDHQELYNDVRDPVTLETGPAIICMAQRRRCRYSQQTVTLCPDRSGGDGVECTDGRCKLL